MKDFWKKNKVALVIVGSVLITPLLFYYGTSFMLKNIQAKADMIQERIIDSNIEKAKIDKIPEMEKANANFEKDKEAVGTILSSVDRVDFIEYIESLASETSNKITLKVLDDNKSSKKVVAKAKPKVANEGEDSPAKEEKKSIEESLSYKQYISMQVDLEGNYESFLNFIHKLENNKYYVNILSFDLQKSFTKEDAVKTDIPVSRGIFLSPVSQDADSGSSQENGAEAVLKSMLSIIVYTE